MNHLHTSTSERVSSSEIDKRISKAKKEKLRIHLEEHGYYFCTKCGRNDCKPIDCSHNISVDECKKSGRCELAWDLDNIEIIGRKCHQEKDGLDLKFNK